LAYDKAIEINQSCAIAWSHKGNAFLNWSRYDDAIKCYDKAIEIDPQLVGAWYNKALALNVQGKYEETIQALDKAHKNLKPIQIYKCTDDEPCPESL